MSYTLHNICKTNHYAGCLTLIYNYFSVKLGKGRSYSLLLVHEGKIIVTFVSCTQSPFQAFLSVPLPFQFILLGLQFHHNAEMIFFYSNIHDLKNYIISRYSSIILGFKTNAASV